MLPDITTILICGVLCRSPIVKWMPSLLDMMDIGDHDIDCKLLQRRHRFADIGCTEHPMAVSLQ